MRKIITLDDHCQEKYFYLLEDYLDLVKKYFKDKHNESVEFIKCSDVRELANVLLGNVKIECDGWIIDVMLHTEALVNYALLGRPDILSNSARSGILALRAIIEYDNPINNLPNGGKSRLAALANRPALLFSALRKYNLAREINEAGILSTKGIKIFSASKAEVDVVDLKLSQDVQEWCDQVMKTDDSLIDLEDN